MRAPKAAALLTLLLLASPLLLPLAFAQIGDPPPEGGGEEPGGGGGGSCAEGAGGEGAPVTSFAPEGTLGGEGWYRSAVTLRFSSTPSGGTTCFSVDGGSFQPYDDVFPEILGTSGTFTVRYFTTLDGAPTEATKEATVKIDRTAPAMSLPSGHKLPLTFSSSSPCAGLGTGTARSNAERIYDGSAPVVVTVLSAAENAGPASSGLASATVEIVNGTTSTGFFAATAPYTLTFTAEGNYTIRLTATDRAGNSPLGGTDVRCVHIDKTPPTASLGVHGPASEGLALVRLTSTELLRRATELSNSARQATLQAVSPSSATTTHTFQDALSPRGVWGVVPLGEAGTWTLTGTVRDEADWTGTASATVAVTPRADFAGLVSLAAAPPALSGCGATPCDKDTVVFSAVFDPGEAGHVPSGLRLDVQRVAVDGSTTTLSLAPTATTADGADRVSAWWNLSLDTGAVAYRLGVLRPSGATDASAWRGVVVRDAEGPTLLRSHPGTGSVHANGSVRELTGEWYDPSGVDAKSLSLRLMNLGTMVETELAPSTNVDEWKFRHALATPLTTGEYKLTIEVKDALGNLAAYERLFTVQSQSSGGGSSGGSGGTSGSGSYSGSDCVGGTAGQGASGTECGSTGGSTGGSAGGSAGSSGGGSSSGSGEDRSPPTLSAFGPTGTLVEQYPDVFARYSDPSGVLPSSVVLELDGERVRVNATSSGVTYSPQSPLAPGPHRVSILLDDASGNSLRASWRFIVLPRSLGGERAYAHEPLAPADEPFVVRFGEGRLRLESVELVPETSLRNATLWAERLDRLPATVTPPAGDPLSLLDVSLRHDGGDSAALSRVLLRFSVPRSELKLVGAEPGQVLAFHYRDMRWVPLAGGVEGENATHVTYAFEAAGLSPFALVTDTSAPTVTPVAPVDGAVLRDVPAVHAEVADNVALRGVVVALNGVILASENGTGGAIAATPPADVADGRHTVEVRATDAAGNVDARTWTFILDRAGPTFPRSEPQGSVASARPRLEIAFSDAVSGVDPATVRVTLDGVDVTASAAVTAFGVTLDPPGDLAPGAHRFEVRVADRAGNAATHEHSFVVAEGSRVLPAPGSALALAAALGVGLALRAARRRTP